MSSKHILLLVGDFVEDYEAMVPLQILQMVGHQVDTVCPDKPVGSHVVTAIHDFEGHQTYSEKWGHNFAITTNFERIVPDDYDGLVIPGGRSPEYLQLNEQVLEIVRHFATKGKPLAVTCHGPYLLSAAGVVGGRRCQAYPTLRPELERAGAIWDPPSAEFDSVCVDGNLVSAPAWPANPAWMREFLRILDK
ncbi:DJ-1/PfpI family protein [Bythopirellula polymerisocia]|uniref:General stress protein 18 n=1 Tax=Bythopirellula polymerisocia TaxID=2528003 RepID=A0A5C6CT35_9BACT|nr:DJ-1/PfpI family protein [Bythopirellula polymerisocia]TWU25909.1 General stress protein 18 [Bythopirellula polymerisocia]